MCRYSEGWGGGGLCFTAVALLSVFPRSASNAGHCCHHITCHPFPVNVLTHNWNMTGLRTVKGSCIRLQSNVVCTKTPPMMYQKIPHFVPKTPRLPKKPPVLHQKKP